MNPKGASLVDSRGKLNAREEEADLAEVGQERCTLRLAQIVVVLLRFLLSLETIGQFIVGSVSRRENIR